MMQESETQKTLVTKDMTIGEVVEKFPETASVMESFGLHCVGCHSNPFETLEMGAMGHGMSESQVYEMLVAINKSILSPEDRAKLDLNKPDVELTLPAAAKLKELAAQDNKSEYGLRVGIEAGGCHGNQYAMDFELAPREEDKVLESNGLKIFLNAESQRLLKGTVIDYVESEFGGGFKISNPNAQSTCGCGNSFH